jgi:hypothetical protein
MAKARLKIESMKIDHKFELSSDVKVGDIFTVLVPNPNIVVERGSLAHLKPVVSPNMQFPIPVADAHYTVQCKLVSAFAFNIIRIE